MILLPFSRIVLLRQGLGQFPVPLTDQMHSILLAPEHQIKLDKLSLIEMPDLTIFSTRRAVA